MKRRPSLRCALVGVLLSSGLLAGDAHAFTHVVRKGETLASIATRVYGRPDYEHILVGANALDAQGGSIIAPGMRLEVPALSYHRAALGDTWSALAERLLGDPRYSTILSEANGSHPWLLPDPGALLVIPYVLRHYADADQTIFDLAGRYLGDKMLAWQLVAFNDLKGNDIRRGAVILVPLTRLALTPEGEAEAAAGTPCLPCAAVRYERQRAVNHEMPRLMHLLDQGQWLDVVELANRLLGNSDLTRGQKARLGKALATSYVALDAIPLAVAACRLYLDNVSTPHLEPATTSPKLRAVCRRES